jgi:hypothetical protein
LIVLSVIAQVRDAILQHPLIEILFDELGKCRLDSSYCDENYVKILKVCVNIANDHASLLLYSEAQDIFKEVFYYIEPNTMIGQRVNHILAVLSFSQGNFLKVFNFLINKQLFRFILQCIVQCKG